MSVCWECGHPVKGNGPSTCSTCSADDRLAPERLDADLAPWEWSWGFYPTEGAARAAYNSLYPEGARSGVVARVVPDHHDEIGSCFRLDLTCWPEASRARAARRKETDAKRA